MSPFNDICFIFLILVSHGDSKMTTTKECLGTLPAIVACKILSYLDWREKLSFCKNVVPDWTQHLYSSNSWTNFIFRENILGLENNGGMGVENYYEEIPTYSDEKNLILEFGKYFQSCLIDFETSGGLQIFNEIGEHAVNLKYIQIFHSPVLFYCPPAILEYYYSCLGKLVSNCKKLHHLSMCRLDELSADEVEMKGYFFSRIIDIGIIEQITGLDFSMDSSYVTPINILTHFKNLQTLKTTFCTVTTDIMRCLGKQNLKELYLVKDNRKVGRDFQEIAWESLAVQDNIKLDVHFIFQDTRIYVKDFPPNPFVKSIVFNRMVGSVSRDILRAIAAYYGQTLETYAHFSMKYVTLHPYEDMESLPCDYYYFASQCVKLQTFISSVPLPSEAVWCLAMKGNCLKSLCVTGNNLLFNYNVCLPFPASMKRGGMTKEFLSSEVSSFLGLNWTFLSEDEMLEKKASLLHAC